MKEYPPMFSTPSLAPSVRTRVVRFAGAVYGLIFALGFAAAMWGLDAVILQQASFNLAWAKFVPGLILIALLAMLAGWLATLSRWTFVGILVWIVAAPLIALVAGHLPYDGMSLVAELGDPYATGRMMYPFTLPAAAFTGLSMVIGAGMGLITGLLQMLATERAWNHSTADNRLGPRSILSLCMCLPFAVFFGALADFQINAPTRSAIVDVARAVDTALDPSKDLGAARLPFLESHRDEMTPNHRLYLVQYSDSLETATVDAVFDSGLLLRCQQGYGVVFFCNSFDRNLSQWMTELMTSGNIACTDCPVSVDGDMLNWLAAALPTLGQAQDVALLQHQGGWLYERATFPDGRAVDCRFRGNRPIAIDMCVEATR